MIKNLVTLAIICVGANARVHQKPADSVLISGIDKDDLMQNQKSHWQKNWPQGDTDDGTNDEDVMNLSGDDKKKKKKDTYTYPWKLDDDIVDSQNHLEYVEGKLNKKFGVEGYQDRGLAIVNSGDKEIKNWYL